jgi:hypothetical protein
MFVLHAAKLVIKAGFGFVINNFLVQKDAVRDAEVIFKMTEMVDFDSPMGAYFIPLSPGFYVLLTRFLVIQERP